MRSSQVLHQALFRKQCRHIRPPHPRHRRRVRAVHFPQGASAGKGASTRADQASLAAGRHQRLPLEAMATSDCLPLMRKRGGALAHGRSERIRSIAAMVAAGWRPPTDDRAAALPLH